MTVVIGVDGSESSLHALDWAADEAARLEVPLTVVHCLRLPMFPSDLRHPFVPPVIPADDPAHEVVAAACARAVAAHPDLVVERRITDGPPGEVLPDLAQDADLVVVGSHGKGLASALIGSTARHVVQHAGCPAVVVRPRTVREAPAFANGVVIGVDGSPAATAALGYGFAAAHHRQAGVAVVHVQPDVARDWYFDRRFLDSHGSDALARALLDRRVDPWANKYPDVPITDAFLRDDPIPGSAGRPPALRSWYSASEPTGTGSGRLRSP